MFTSRPSHARVAQRALLVSALAVASAVALSACAEGSGTPTSNAASTLTVGLSANPDTLDPGATGLASSLNVTSQIFDTLIYRFPGSSDWEAGLASSYSVNSDATAYTFTLKKGVAFQDGTPFTADAVKATFDHVVAPATHSLIGASALGPYKDTVVVDKYTARVEFKSSYPSFNEIASESTLGIDSPTALKKWGADYGTHPVGTGPFKLASFVKNSSIGLKRNPKYTWGPKTLGSKPASLSSLTFKVLTDPSTQDNALTTGEIQVASNLTSQDAIAAQKKGFSVIGGAA